MSIFKNNSISLVDPEIWICRVFRRQEHKYSNEKFTRCITEGLHSDLSSKNPTYPISRSTGEIEIFSKNDV